MFHKPVLLREVLDSLEPSKGKRYIDATLGGGGHAKAIVEKDGIVLGIDQDPDALEFVEENFAEDIAGSKLKVARGNFADIKKIAEENEFVNIDGVLFDLGVSSYQLDRSGRGFSFRRQEPLDMRMSLDGSSLTAKIIVNTYGESELYELFSKGEEPNAKAVARAIIEARHIKPIETSDELGRIISGVGKSQGLIHPATRVFQALRMTVNREPESLRQGLEGAFDILKSGGKVSVISFHSLEDRIVKLYFLKLERMHLARVVNKKPVIAGNDEVDENRRSRSAKLRTIIKL